MFEITRNNGYKIMFIKYKWNRPELRWYEVYRWLALLDELLVRKLTVWYEVSEGAD